MSNGLTFPTVAVTGGAGYVGSALVPRLVTLGHRVRVIDLFLFGEDVFGAAGRSERLERVELDIRDWEGLRKALAGVDAVIHLACVSNDPSFELDPALGKSINYDSFPGLLEAITANGVKRFINASSSSVYGVKEEPDVTEDTPCEPITDYSKYKLLCEQALQDADLGSCEWVTLRPATVCGYAPRLRLDVVVNILTINALARKQITVFGGDQLRPNVNIGDMVRAYELMLSVPADKIHRQTFNLGYQNLKVIDIARLVKRVVADPEVALTVQETDDHRSYHVNSDRVRRALGFEARHDVEDAVRSICDAYRSGRIPDALTDPRYYNIRTMQQAKLK